MYTKFKVMLKKILEDMIDLEDMILIAALYINIILKQYN